MCKASDHEPLLLLLFKSTAEWQGDRCQFREDHPPPSSARPSPGDTVADPGLHGPATLLVDPSVPRAPLAA